MKMGPDVLGTVENESGSAKQENWTQRPRYLPKKKKQDPTPSVPPKMCHGSQNMKMEPNTLGTALNESGTCKPDPTPSVQPNTSPSAQNMKSA
jgi:hypothetical protein